MEKKKPIIEKVEGDKIILNGQGKFPKLIVIFNHDRRQEYKLVRSKNGKFLLNV
jgi:hypothetical protein